MNFNPDQINKFTLDVSGRIIKIGRIKDEEWRLDDAIENPETLIRFLNGDRENADLFTFAQKLPYTQPRYEYPMEWDNVAAIPITTFEEWWEKRLPQVTRKSVRRGNKRGVIAKLLEFNDELIRGIVGIHNDTLMKQGRPFAHYGKDFDLVKKEYGTYLDRSEFLGAYFGNELIGIIKLVYIGNCASIMQIITKEQHYDKRPTNVLIAKAVEICENKGIGFLIYGKYVYGKKANSSLTEFKRRNGFEQINFPRYYVPLTFKGRIAIKLNLHLGLLGILPGGVISFLRDLRARYIRIKLQLKPRRTWPSRHQDEEKTGRDREGD